MEVALLLPLLAPAQSHAITVLAALQSPDFCAKANRNTHGHGTLCRFEAFSGTSKERDAETRHLLLSE